MSRVLLISRSRRFENRLRTLFSGDLDTIMGISLARGASAALSTLHTDEGPDIALLGPSLSYAQAYELSVALTARYPRAALMLVRENGPATKRWMSDMKFHGLASPSLADAALVEAVNTLGYRQGAGRHVRPADEGPEPPLSQPVGPGQLTGELSAGLEAAGPDSEPLALPSTQVQEAPPPDTPGVGTGQVIAVVSPKGGMGKTTVATNLAVGLARLAPMSVVLIDADVQFGDVATALGLSPAYTLPDVVSDAATRDDMVLKAYLTSHHAHFYTVCGAASPVDGDRVTGEQLGILIDQLSRVFRYVVIDTAPGLGDHTLAAIERADDVVLLCGMSVTSARGLRNHVAALSTIGMLPQSRHLVLNFADRISGLSVRDVEAITGVPVDVAIPRSPHVTLSSNRGIPLLEEGRRDRETKALGELVRRFDPSSRRETRRMHRRVVVR